MITTIAVINFIDKWIKVTFSMFEYQIDYGLTNSKINEFSSGKITCYSIVDTNHEIFLNYE